MLQATHYQLIVGWFGKTPEVLAALDDYCTSLFLSRPNLRTAEWYLNDRYLGGQGRIRIANTFTVSKFFQCPPVLVPTSQFPSETSRWSAPIERIGRAATAML